MSATGVYSVTRITVDHLKYSMEPSRLARKSKFKVNLSPSKPVTHLLVLRTSLA